MSERIVLFCEGDTEEIFYKKLFHHLLKSSNKKIELTIRNFKGIGNCKDKPIKVFENEIISKFKDDYFYIFIAFDNDIFMFNRKPPLDFETFSNIRKLLIKKKKVREVYPLVAQQCIEDWFLLDLNGLQKYLSPNSKGPIKLPEGKDAVEKMKKLFEKYNKMYINGYATEDFVECLDLNKIIKKNIECFLPILQLLDLEKMFT